MSGTNSPVLCPVEKNEKSVTRRSGKIRSHGSGGTSIMLHELCAKILSGAGGHFYLINYCIYD